MNRLGREVGESIGFFSGLVLYWWGLKNNNGDLAWTFLALWPFLAFVPLIIGPRYFRISLVVIGALIAVIYGVSQGWASGNGYLGVGGGISLSGICLTPRTQRALGILRLFVAAVIVAIYAYLPFTEPSFGTGGMVVFAPLAFLIIIGLLVRTRTYLRAGAAEQWYLPRLFQEISPEGSKVDELADQP